MKMYNALALGFIAVTTAACGSGGGGEGAGGAAAPTPDAVVVGGGTGEGGGLGGGGASPGPADGAPVPMDGPPLVVVDAELDAAPDAAPPRRADEQPTEGESNRPGAGELSAAVGPGQARAGRIDAPAERLTGPEANCRVGDYRLDNARISLCIQDEDTYGIFGFSGGTLIDAHRADRPGTDLFQELIVSPEVGSASAEHVGIVRDGADGGAAIVRVEGRAMPSRLIQGVLPGRFVPPDFRMVTEYRLAPDSDSVDILTWIEGDRVGGRALMADVVFFGDRTRSFIPATGADGFAPNPAAYLAADGRAVSYLYSGDGPLSFLAIPTSETPVTAITHGTASLRVGDQTLIRRRLTVGSGDVESARLRGEGETAVTLTGLPEAPLDITAADGKSFTRVALEADGRRVFSLPAGEFRVSTSDTWLGAPVRDVPLTVGAAAVDLPLDLTAPATLRVRAHDTQGDSIAVRLTLVDDAGEELVRFVVDEGTFALPPGNWHVVATRGWHYTVDERDVRLESGAEATADVVLEEVLPFEGWVGGEFHQHASPSADSDVDPADRVLSNLTEGVGFMGPSEHDIVWDFAAQVERMGLTDRLMVFQGTEISPVFTHMGAYPMPHRPDESGGGGVVLPVFENGAWRARRVPELVAEARRLGAEIVQINHPRSSAGYFSHLGYEPGRPLDDLSPDDFTRDINSVEVFNESDAFCEIMTDWLSLLNQGLRLTAVGNSDTHSVSQPPGYPRNYLPTLADAPAHVLPGEIVDALREGTIFVGGGAVMDFPEGPLPGETVTPTGEGELAVRVRLRTPPWANLTHLYALVNGSVVWETALTAEESFLTDFDDVVRVPVALDAHVVFLAVGPRLRFVRGGKPTFALSNPVWVDVNGGGIEPLGNVPAQMPALEFCD